MLSSPIVQEWLKKDSALKSVIVKKSLDECIQVYLGEEMVQNSKSQS